MSNSEVGLDVFKFVTEQLGRQVSEAERGRLYELIERDLDRERSQRELDFKVGLQVREDRRRAAKQRMLFVLCAAGLILATGVVLVLREFRDSGFFILGCGAALLGIFMVDYK